MSKPKTSLANASIKGNARELILDTAEKLFAEQGVEAVSLRAINAAAGVSPGVLHYHFGNREVLVTELVERRMQGLMEQRQSMLDALKQSKEPGINEVVATLITPLAEFVLNGGDAGQRYVQFIARLYADRSPILEKVSERYMPGNTSQLSKLIKKTCPHLTTRTIGWRLMAANNAMLHTLAELSKPPRPWQQTQGKQAQSKQSQLHTRQSIDSLTAFIIGGFCAGAQKD